jgi:hypothetical protein
VADSSEHSSGNENSCSINVAKFAISCAFKFDQIPSFLDVRPTANKTDMNLNFKRFTNFTQDSFSASLLKLFLLTLLNLSQYDGAIIHK